MEVDNELDKKRIVERFEKEIEVLTEYFKKSVFDVRKDFNDDIRNINKMRCRDKSDMDVRLLEIDNGIKISCKDILKH